MHAVASSKRLARPQLWLLAAFAAVVAIFFVHTRDTSMSIDGERYFWLDDDQMVSMRYARNLAEGHGLVWNAGEHVEGYSNLGWVLVMAAVHLLPLPDRLTSLGVLAVSLLLCIGVVVLAARLLEALQPRHLALTLPAALACIVGCTDVMFWAVSGFETTLVTLLHLAVVLGAVRRRRLDWLLLLPLSLVPVVRSDGLHIWLGDALLLLWLAESRLRTLRSLALSLVPLAASLVFRLVYYGELLPNTYYLKVADLDGRWQRGLEYGSGFVSTYWLVLVFAAATAASLWKRDPRSRAFLTSLAPALLFSIYVGGDVFHPFRFLAHVMPELMVWAAIGATRLVVALLGRVVWLLTLVVFVVPLTDTLERIAPIGTNGDPFEQVVVGALLRKNADPGSSVAVIASGMVPYFSRLESIDLLGKSDAHIAHLEPRKGAIIGHGKMDAEYSLAKRPDYVVSLRARTSASAAAPRPSEGDFDYVWELLSSPSFRRDWEENPVPDPFLLECSAVYVASDSPEMAKTKSWSGVTLAP